MLKYTQMQSIQKRYCTSSPVKPNIRAALSGSQNELHGGLGLQALTHPLFNYTHIYNIWTCSYIYIVYVQYIFLQLFYPPAYGHMGTIRSERNRSWELRRAVAERTKIQTSAPFLLYKRRPAAGTGGTGRHKACGARHAHSIKTCERGTHSMFLSPTWTATCYTHICVHTYK